MQLQEEKANSQNRVLLSSDYTLPYKAKPENYPIKYGVVFTVNNGEVSNEIKYELEITQLKSAQPGTGHFMIDRVGDIYINGITPDLLAEQLAYEAGKVFYPLNIETDRNGKFTRVTNYKDIHKRWLAKREYLIEYFIGDAAFKYIKLMDEAMSSEARVNTTMSKDPFISVYFNGLYKSYSPRLTVNKDVTLPFTGTALQAAYAAQQTINAELNSFGDIEISHSGKLNDDRSIEDFEQGLNFSLSKLEQPDSASATGEYESLYVVNPQYNLIEAAISNWTLQLIETKSFNLKLFQVNLVNSTNKNITTNKQHILVENTSKDDKQGGGIFSKFMESLFGK